ncbi:metallophosphoesterase [Sporosarcina sp. Te-1]|uniref:metallophosphoesterase n=1 Tax=Sporosarcina sp. Te-1 TaxID=2818390 RepID=UPI001A9FD49E|nr:metallophosphoesterase [Sporosarcina sp. Te-1]QTD42200.1 metallophosphoesterase [Sporosarcina sp. Te-1]
MKGLLKLTGIFFLAASGLAVCMLMNARQRNVRFHELEVADETDDRKKLTVLFISDIHRRVIDKRLLKKIKKHGWLDVIIIGGDLAERGVPIQRVEQNVRELAVLGKSLYYIWGNNDREVGETSIRDIVAKYNGIILDNMNVPIPEHPDWCIVGTDDPSSKNVDVHSAMGGTDQFEHILVATHTPSLFRKIKDYANPTIMMAGHTHGGQIRFGPFGLHDKGAFTIQNRSAQLISNGYGTSLLPLRLGAPPECHILHIYY